VEKKNLEKGKQTSIPLCLEENVAGSLSRSQGPICAKSAKDSCVEHNMDWANNVIASKVEWFSWI
jgi:hypothetical protein